MENLVTIFTRIAARKELSNRALGLQCGVSHNTIARYKSLIAAYDLSEADIARRGEADLARIIRAPAVTKYVEPVWDAERRKLQGGNTRHEAWQQYRDAVGEEKAMSYRTYCGKIQALTGMAEPTMHMVHVPGDAVMVDFAGYRPAALGPEGGPVKVELFVATLPNSGFTFACVCRSQAIEDWLWVNMLALEYFGGIPSKIIPDNLKAAVISRKRGRLPQLTPAFVNFCDHYGLQAVPARPRKPRDKASVEAHVKIVQREVAQAFAKLSLMSIDEMNRRIRVIVDAINDRPIRRLVTEKRRVLFETCEKSELKPLPAERFAYFNETRVGKLPADYCVVVDPVAYSVPSTLVGHSVKVRTYHDHIEVWHDGREVACHKRRHEPGLRVILPQHMPENHRQWAERDTLDLEAWAADFDDNVMALVRTELARKLSGAAAKSQVTGITRLPREFQREPFMAACKLAAEQGCPTLVVVRNLLENHRHTGSLPVKVASKNPPNTNARGAAYYAIEEKVDA